MISSDIEEKMKNENSFMGCYAKDKLPKTFPKILPKTIDVNSAEECLKLISGRRHKVFTSFTVYTPNNSLKTKTIQSIIKFKRLHPDEISYYLATKEWEGKAGGYAIQGIAASFINFISGSYSNVVGLPLAEFYRVLTSIGYNLKND